MGLRFEPDMWEGSGVPLLMTESMTRMGWRFVYTRLHSCTNGRVDVCTCQVPVGKRMCRCWGGEVLEGQRCMLVIERSKGKSLQSQQDYQ